MPEDRRPALLVHKSANVLNKLPKSQELKTKCALQVAETKRDALAAFDAFVQTWGAKYDKARVTLCSFPTERGTASSSALWRRCHIRSCGVDAASVGVLNVAGVLDTLRHARFKKIAKAETNARRRPRAVGGELPELGRLNRKRSQRSLGWRRSSASPANGVAAAS